MGLWLEKAKERCKCDICGKIIEKGEARYCDGYRSLYHRMIFRNICKKCYEEDEYEW